MMSLLRNNDDADLNEAIQLSLVEAATAAEQLRQSLDAAADDEATTLAILAQSGQYRGGNEAQLDDATRVAARDTQENGWRDANVPCGLQNTGNKCYLNALLQMYFWLSPALTEVLVSRPHLSSGRHDEFLVQLRRLFVFMSVSHLRYVSPVCLSDVLALDMRQQDVSEFNHHFLELLSSSVCESVRQEIEHLFYGTKYQKLLPFRDGIFQHDDMSQTSFRIGPGDFAIELSVDPSIDNMAPSIARTPSSSSPSTAAGNAEEQKQLQRSSTDMIEDASMRDVEAPPPSSSSSTSTAERTNQPPIILPGNTLERALESMVRSVVEEPVRLQLLEFHPPPVLWIDLKRFQYDAHNQRVIKNNAAFDFPERFYADVLYRHVELTSELQQRITNLESEIQKHQSVFQSVITMYEFYTYREQFFGADGLPEQLSVAKRMLEFYVAPLRAQLEGWQREVDDARQELARLRASFTNNPYDLYAVMVHVGEPESGHYYAFINIPSRGGWFKMNDRDVAPVSSWQLVRDECLGGGGSSGSAYCLVYVDHSRMPRSMAQQAKEVLYPPQTLKSWEDLQHYSLDDPLPKDLRTEVDESNLQFLRDYQQAHPEAADRMTDAATASSTSSTATTTSRWPRLSLW